MTNENIQLSEQDEKDLATMLGEAAAEAPKRTLLATWANLLGNIEASDAARVEPRVALRVISAWPQLTLQEVPEYFRRYHSRLAEMREVLTVEIETAPQALERVEDDAEENKAHYLNLLAQWQILALSWEMEWDITAEDAHIELASFADAANYVIGDSGIVGHLDAIQFQYTEDDQATVAAAVLDWRGDR